MRLLRIDHVQVTAPRDREKEAHHFYADVLGLKEVARPQTLGSSGLWYAFEEAHELHIVFGAEVPRLPAGVHFAIMVDDLEDVKRQLADHEVPYEPSPVQAGYARIFVNDPFGNRIEFLAPES